MDYILYTLGRRFFFAKGLGVYLLPRKEQTPTPPDDKTPARLKKEQAD